MYLKEYDNNKPTRVYEEHYGSFVECELCGHQTRGRVYVDEPEVVYCSSCNGPLVGNPFSESSWD